MIYNTFRACIILPFAVVFGMTILALAITHTLVVAPQPELETFETFMWIHTQP